MSDLLIKSKSLKIYPLGVGNRARNLTLQGYLAHTTAPPPRALHDAYLQPYGVPREEARRITSEGTLYTSDWVWSWNQARPDDWYYHLLQGYLAHKKQRPPSTLQ